MKTAVASVLVVGLLFTAALAAHSQVPPEVWRKVAGQMAIGSQVKIRTVSGDRLTGILFAEDDEGIIVKRRTRVPEPAQRIVYGQIDSLKIDNARTGFGKAAGIGAGIGGAVIAVVFLMAAHGG